MTPEKCPFCGAEKVMEINRYLSPTGAKAFIYKCGRHVKTELGTDNDNRDSDHCKLIVAHRELEAKHERMVDIVDRIIEIEKVRTSRNYCGHACPLSEPMIELINERKVVEG